jgi:hypothetical protein
MFPYHLERVAEAIPRGRRLAAALAIMVPFAIAFVVVAFLMWLMTPDTWDTSIAVR